MRPPATINPAAIPDPSTIKPRPPVRRKATEPTTRQMLTAAAMLFGDRRCRPTQTELAKRFGVSPAAISRRLKRFESLLSHDQRERYLQCMSIGKGRKRRLTPVQLSVTFGVV